MEDACLEALEEHGNIGLRYLGSQTIICDSTAQVQEMWFNCNNNLFDLINFFLIFPICKPKLFQLLLRGLHI